MGRGGVRAAGASHRAPFRGGTCNGVKEDGAPARPRCSVRDYDPFSRVSNPTSRRPHSAGGQFVTEATPCRSRAFSRVVGSAGAGSGSAVAAGHRTEPAPRPSSPSRAGDDLLVRATDEVPPHDQSARRTARRRAGTAGRPGRANARSAAARAEVEQRPRARARRPPTSAAPAIASTRVLEVGAQRQRSPAAGQRDLARPRSGCGRPPGDRAPANSPTSTVTSQSRRATAGRSRGARSRPALAGRRRAAPPTAAAPCMHRRVHGGDCSEWAMPCPAVIRLSWPGRIRCTLPRLSRCRISPSTSQVTVCRPVCGCGGTCMPGRLRHVVRAEMVDETPRADHPPLPLRQQPRTVVYRPTARRGRAAAASRGPRRWSPVERRHT